MFLEEIYLNLNKTTVFSYKQNKMKKKKEKKLIPMIENMLKV